MSLVLNLNTDLPKWGSHTTKEFSVESPIFIYQRESDSKYFPHLSLKCSDDCGAAMDVYYYGLNHYWPSEKTNSADTIDFSPRYAEHKPKDAAGNISIDISNEQIMKELSDFLTETPKVMKFKQELDKGFHAVVELRIKDQPEICLNVRKEADKINFNLERINDKFSKVPLLEKATRYRDALGIIHSVPLETDLSSLLINDYAKLDNPVLKGVIEWVKLLGNENDADLSVRNIWVRPYNR